MRHRSHDRRSGGQSSWDDWVSGSWTRLKGPLYWNASDCVDVASLSDETSQRHSVSLAPHYLDHILWFTNFTHISEGDPDIFLDIFPPNISPLRTIPLLFTWCSTFPPSTTTIRQCCKGDDAKAQNLTPLPPRPNPISDSHKNWQRWSRRGPLHLCNLVVENEPDDNHVTIN